MRASLGSAAATPHISDARVAWKRRSNGHDPKSGFRFSDQIMPKK